VWLIIHDQLTFDKPENPSLVANLPEGEELGEVISYMDYIDMDYPSIKNDEGVRDADRE